VVRAVGEAAWAALRRRSARLDAGALATLSPMLILSPHQDDETLGCGGLIATACAQGLAPRVAFVTDGAASHRGSQTWPPERLAAARRREALRALATLGVPSRDVRFLGWPDGAPLAEGAPDYQRTLVELQSWARSRPPRSLWATWPKEPHCDHEAAAELADALAARLPVRPRRLDYLVWGWTRPELVQAAPERRWALDCPGQGPRRRRALACHRTQTSGLIADADQAFRLPASVAALAGRRTEIFLEAR
jgi:LmbE family N-acetylglucosaminyl deacetylase